VFEPGTASRFIEDYRARAEESKVDAGCEQYEIFVSLDDPDRVLLLEHWRDQEAYDEHWEAEQRRRPWPGEEVTREFTIEIYDNHAHWDLGKDGQWHRKAS
jgi:hypothetical protein